MNWFLVCYDYKLTIIALGIPQDTVPSRKERKTAFFPEINALSVKEGTFPRTLQQNVSTYGSLARAGSQINS
jgi:hypothetical protein